MSNPFDADNTALWEDSLAASPPDGLVLFANDRWEIWGTDGCADPFDPTITALEPIALENALNITWQTGNWESGYPYGFWVNGELLSEIDTANTEAEFAIPCGTTITSWKVSKNGGDTPWNTGEGNIHAFFTAAEGDSCGSDINCDCEEENDNLTLAEYRRKMLVRAGFASIASNPPPGTAELFNTFLQDAQAVLYRKYPALETRRFFRWELEVGQRFYGLRDDVKDGCVVNLEPYKNIEGAWLIDLNGQWLPMGSGIPPVWYTTVDQPGLPVRYEIRQCIEIFPGPPAEGYQLVIKGHFGKRAFTAEDSKPTMNGELVYMFALANALDYYGKPSAKNIMAQAEDLLGQLVAGTHGSRRYVPGTQPLPPAVMPVLGPGFWNP